MMKFKIGGNEEAITGQRLYQCTQWLPTGEVVIFSCVADEEDDEAIESGYYLQYFSTVDKARENFMQRMEKKSEIAAFRFKAEHGLIIPT